MSMFSMSSSSVRAGFGGDVGEAVEVDDHHVDGSDAVRGEGAHMIGFSAHGEDAGGDARVDGFNAAIHHFGELSDFGDVGDGDAGIAQKAGCSAGGDELGAKRGEAAGEIGKSGFIGDAEEDALNFGHLKER